MNNSYVVASLGRCGSQLMTVALHNHLHGFKDHSKDFLRSTRPFIRQYPEVFKNNMVYKTHLYPINYPQNCKVIFTFGDPLSIVLSVIDKSKHSNWGPAHYQNLNANWLDHKDILSRDVLNLEKMFDSFYQPQTCSSMCIRYETMWENHDKISDFLGFDFKLPEKKERRADRFKKQLSVEQRITFKENYKTLLEKIKNAEDCKIWSIK